MSKNLKQLMSIARVDIQLDYFKLFGETAEQYISGNPGEFTNTDKAIVEKMQSDNTVIRVQANPIGKAMEAICYHYDFEMALRDCLKQIKKWRPAK